MTRSPGQPPFTFSPSMNEKLASGDSDIEDFSVRRLYELIGRACTLTAYNQHQEYLAMSSVLRSFHSIVGVSVLSSCRVLCS